MYDNLDPNLCQHRMYLDRGFSFRQCSKKVKVDIGGKKYCAIHSPDAEKKRTEKYWVKVKKREKFEEEQKIINAIKLLKSKGYKIIYPNSQKSN
jgi:hypothetical protein